MTDQTEGKKTEEKKLEAAPKKKKPVFLIRPENSRTGLGDKLKKTVGSAEQAVEDAPKKKEPAKAYHDPADTNTHRVIKPNVKTTAEQYREFAGNEIKKGEERKKRDNTVSEELQEVAKDDAALVSDTVKAPSDAEKKIGKATASDTEKKTGKESAATPETGKKTVKAAKKDATSGEEALPKAENAKKKKAVSEDPVKEAAPSDEKPLEEKAAAAIEAEKPAKKSGKETASPEKPKKAETSDENAKAPVSGIKLPEKPEQKKVSVLGKVDLNAVKQQEERAKDSKKGIFSQKGAGSRVHFVDNRGKEGTDKRVGYSKDGQKSGTFRRDGQKDNRGIFGKDGDKSGAKQGGSYVRVNRDNQSSGASALSKSDIRGKKQGGQKNDKDRGNFDKNGKKAENFRNLSKDQSRKPVRQEKAEEVIKSIVLPDVITIKDLAEMMKIKSADIVKKLFLQGKMMTMNSELSYEEAEEIALEYEILCEKEVQVDVIEELLKEEEEDESLMKKRPPVVCVMGHVDHGKTSLLDAIRKTNVTSREAGGITQHIGAYMVEINGEKITFLDTPGHEAFTAMRMRGAQATDIAVLVVAADDGVMPQTIEAINHAKAAGVEVIVAVNKIDKPAANVDRVKQELSEYELVPEDWGGSTVFVPVSAKAQTNIDTLLEMILLVTEVKELKANPNRQMRGIVIEAKLDKGRGPVATVLVQKGTLKQGDFVSAGSFYGRVRAMLDADGSAMKSATPSTPVEILGLNGVPNAGEVCIGHKNEKDARAYAETFIAEEKKKMLLETKRKLTMDTLFDQIQAGNVKELPIVVKADVQGSVEAVRTSLEKLSNEEVSVKVIHGGVGLINESDVSLASASNAIVIGFNVKPDAQAKALAEQESVDIKLYKVIYQAIDDVEAAMKGMLKPIFEEKVLGHAEVRQTFKASSIGTIAGSYVLDGTLERGAMARITRDKECIFDGNIASLKRFKDDVKEVREGYECGIVFEKFNDVMEGDLVEVYKMVEISRE